MSSNLTNPVDVFFSTDNINLLYETIQSYLYSKHNTAIGREYLSELIEVMKMVVMPIKRVPKDTDVKQFITTLNQRTLMEAIPIFVKAHVKAGKISSEYTLPQPQSHLQPIGQNQLQQSQSQSPHPQTLQPPREMLINRSPSQQIMSLPGGIPQPSYGGSLDDGKRQSQEIEAMFNQMKQTTTNNNKRPPEIDFTKVGNTPQINDPRFKVDVNELYSKHSSQRQNARDVIIPPPPGVQANSQSNQQPNLSSGATSIGALIGVTESQFERDMLEGFQTVNNNNTFNTNDVNGNRSGNNNVNDPINKMSMSNRYEPSDTSTVDVSVDNLYAQSEGLVPKNNLSPSIIFNPNQYIDITPSVNRDITYRTNNNDFTDVAMSMYQYNPNAPQPQQISTLIPKTSRNLVTDSRIIPTIVTVDSRDKDPTQTDNNYRIAIDEIKDVVSIELTDAQIPISEYVVNETNNLLYFEETNGVSLVAVITPGNYSPSELATEIETQMNAVGSSTYTVPVDMLQNKFIINSDGSGGSGIFNLLFDGGTVPIGFEREKTVYLPRSIGEVIGFAPADLTGSLTYTGQYTYNLKGEKYILLYVREAELLKTRDSNVKNAFAKIVLDRPLGETKFYSRNTDNQFIKYYSPPIGRLAYFTIEFKKQNGDYYNFNGQYNSLTFEVTTKDITTHPYEYNYDAK